MKNKKNNEFILAVNKIHGNQSDENDVIFKFEKVHSNSYDYSKVKYLGDKVLVEIICKIHGSFLQSPTNHKQGQGCPYCAGKKLTLEQIINKCNKIHECKYDYSKVVLTKTKEKINIICPEHGEFQQTLNNHKNGQGCKKCYGNEKSTLEKVIKNFIDFHGSKYDYSKMNYINAHTKAIIICPDHGEFSQTPNNHKNGNGCPACGESTGEVQIRTLLEKRGVEYISQYKFANCKNILALPFDFYLPKQNLCIEYNGMQHYKPIEYFGGIEGFKKRKINDKIKEKYCKEYNISLLTIKYNEDVSRKLNFI